MALSAMPFVGEACPFDGNCISDVAQNIDEVRLWEGHFRPCEIDGCFYIIKKGATIVQYSPCNTSAVLGSEFCLQRIYFLQFESLVDLSEALVVITL